MIVGLFSSIFLAQGTLFLFLAVGIYLWNKYYWIIRSLKILIIYLFIKW